MKKILSIVSIALLVYLAWTFREEYMDMHPYYDTILANWNVINVTLMGLIIALIPTTYILFTRKKNFWVLLTSIIGAAILFAFSYIHIKGALYGGGMMLIIHILLLFVLAFFFFIVLEQIGHSIKSSLLKLRTTSITDILVNLGMGLSIFLLLVYVLVLTDMLYSTVSRLFLVAGGVLLWFSREKLVKKWAIIEDTFAYIVQPFHHVWYLVLSLPLRTYVLAALSNGSMTFWGWILFLVGGGLVISYIMKGNQTRDRGGSRIFSRSGLITIITLIMLLLTFWYLFQGIQLAYLPYPTAWDANHAYMFFPKMWAFNHGYYWDEAAMGGGAALRPMYITFFFSLFTNFTSFLGIAPDTIAIEMNFWSGILVLIFGLGLITALLKFLRGKHKSSSVTQLAFLLGWFLLLQWLTSGMGAFLVFIDNKTDMGVLALICIAAYSGFVFLNTLRHMHDENKDTKITPRQLWMYLGLSGVFYAIAVLAKPTALFDVVNFGLFLWIIWFGWIGALGAILLVIGGMTHISFRGIKHYIPQSFGWILMIPGIGGIGVDVIRILLKKSWKYVHYILGWTVCIVVTMVVVKTPFMIIHAIAYDKTYTVEQIIQQIFLSKNGSNLNIQQPLLAQNTNNAVGKTCSLSSQGLQSVEDLYTTTQKAPGNAYNEDVGRYVGFGWKGNATTDARRNVTPLLNPRWAKRFAPGCYRFNPFSATMARDAKLICQYEQSLEQLDITGLQYLADTISDETMVDDEVTVKESIDELVTALTNSSTEEVRAAYGPTINDIRAFMQNNTMKVEYHDGVSIVYLPYKYLTPSNITFNRSLQNLSSYYTDIGIIWLLLFIFAFVGLIYGSIIGKRKLIAISLVTVFGRLLRWMIGGAILRYAIGVIIWSILAFVAYVHYLLYDDETRGLGYIFAFIFLVIGGRQIGMNMIRISSQGGGGAFLQYKTNHGVIEEFTDQLQPQSQISGSFTHEDVFAMQFPHYRKFIKLANERAEDEGALIAGTYARYFVKHQQYIRYDQFLTWLREMFSDNNVCNSYLRLQDQHIKYIVIDPNIGTVVQGAGNQSLFDRFFARVDVTGTSIVEHGTMTMLIELYRAGYIRYVSSNNLGAKYAFILPDTAFGGISGDALTITRARMALARFFNNTALSNAILEIAKQRIQDGMFMTDLADLSGVEIRENYLLNLLKQGQIPATEIATMSTEEKKILSQYLSLRQLAATDDVQYTQQLQNIIRRSISGGNQIIVLELVDY